MPHSGQMSSPCSHVPHDIPGWLQCAFGAIGFIAVGVLFALGVGHLFIYGMGW